MPRRTLPLLLVVSVCVIAAGACGHKSKVRTAASTTTSLRATTSTVAPANGYPLTGLPAADAAVKGRPALVIKIDDAPLARPQYGLNDADVVVVEKVEDGVTRFFAVFQSKDSPRVEPVRSARVTDTGLVGSLNRPLYAYSGGNERTVAKIHAAPLVDVGYNAQPAEFHRDGDRRRPPPYNLFTATLDLRKHTPAGAGPPPAWFTYRPAGQGATGAGVTPASTVHLEYRGKHINTIVDYQWDAPNQAWARTQDGGPHVDASGARVSPRNVVVQLVDYVDTGDTDVQGNPVPQAQLVGTGEAWILSDGKVVKGTWSKPSEDKVTAFNGPDGKPVPLTPGQTWLELAVRGNPNTVS
ncbi:MAG: hypothetical protein QOG03_410 [Actinomycetota bacterium]|jgi:hypothetical protein|nr:hypothetical protein [Actinomycetota bacterium]